MKVAWSLRRSLLTGKSKDDFVKPDPSKYSEYTETI
jgi:hypothetical protein